MTTGSLHRTASINQSVFADQNQAGEWAGSQEETPAGRVISTGPVSESAKVDVVHTPPLPAV